MCRERVTSDRLSSSGSKCARKAETREEEVEVVGELKAEEEAVQKEGEEAEVGERRRRRKAGNKSVFKVQTKTSNSKLHL